VTLGALVTAGAAVTATQLLGGTSGSNGSGTATAKQRETPKPKPDGPPSKALTLGGALDVADLAPGIAVTRDLVVSNPNGQDVELRSVVTALDGPSPAPAGGSCDSPADLEVVVAGYDAVTGTGAPVTIARNTSVQLPVTVELHNSPTRNQDACKGRTWTFTFTATATSK
jgi:hypothetical protein